MALERGKATPSVAVLTQVAVLIGCSSSATSSKARTSMPDDLPNLPPALTVEEAARSEDLDARRRTRASACTSRAEARKASQRSRLAHARSEFRGQRFSGCSRMTPHASTLIASSTSACASAAIRVAGSRHEPEDRRAIGYRGNLSVGEIIAALERPGPILWEAHPHQGRREGWAVCPCCGERNLRVLIAVEAGC